MTTEEPKRKAHSKEVYRELFAKSGNMCAWPEYSHLMITAGGKFIGQICHIEGVKGERFREDMTNDERAAVSNLMLLCYEHHKETDDESVWTVERLQKTKSDHEALFTDADSKIYNAYVDRSGQKPLRKCLSAKRFSDVLDWPNQPAHLKETTDELNNLFGKLALLDIQSRIFVLAVVRRAYAVRHTVNVYDKSGHLLLRWDDFTENTGTPDHEVKKRIQALEAHDIGTYDDDTMEIADGYVLAIRLNRAPVSQVDYWLPIAEFCERTAEPLDSLIVDLDLSRFD